jgi:MOSC domain-containing protein YiiM
MMGKVIKIGITDTKGSEICSVNKVKTLKGKGLFNDRKLRDENKKDKQITLIEIESINFYNNKFGTNFEPLNFRRNIVTKNINLNNLIGKEFLVGNIKLKAHDLCRPCKYLQEKLKIDNFVKEFLLKGGIRCEIMTSGTINLGDIIKI